MKIVLVFVATLDGKITKWGDPFVRKWSSKEDQDYFTNLWNNAHLIVMGSKTYDADMLKPSPHRLAVVMTTNPLRYKQLEIPGQLEFSNNTPEEIVARFTAGGYGQMMVVGGPHIATSFIKAQLIDELWLTIEPIIFGSGGSFVIEEELDINLRLISCEKVNEHGTLFTRYTVVKNEK